MRAEGASSWITSFWHYAEPIDRITWTYILAFAVGLVVLGRDHPSWRNLFMVHMVLLGTIAVILTVWHGRTDGIAGLVRLTYPAILYTFFYIEMGAAIHWLYSGFMDYQVVALERAVLGVDLNIWLTRLQTPLVNEWMMLGYASYYALIPILALTFFVRHRIDELRSLLTATTTTFVMSYVLFIIYPVEGPRFYFADELGPPLEGYVLVPLVQLIIERGAIHGGCVPSTHSAIALIVLIWAYRTYRRLAIILTPFVITLFVGTVWGHYHYLTDVVVGLILALIGLYLADRWSPANRRAG
ncbi:MAG: phosphatase PAP2 family protein [candidate division Zixibacteria bacterium]|nr:phosphatase PAP2 family protein [candidate division Zixibacteria bacterium]